MIQIRLYCTLILLLFLSSCIRTETEKQQSVNLKIEYLNLKESKSITDKGKIDLSFKLPIFYQDLKFINSTINKRIDNYLENENVNSNYKTLNEGKLNEIVNNYVSKLSQDYSDIEESSVPDFYMNINMDTVYNNKSIIIVSEHFESYTGGAHDSYSDLYYDFDIEKQKLLELNDIFDVEELTEIAENYFLQEKGLVKKSADLKKEGYWFENNKFHLNNNFYFTNKSLIFIYNIYEITSFSEGEISLEIPLDKLKNIIKKEYEFIIN